MTWHLLYNDATGKAVSIGTVIADPLPDGIVAVVLSDADADALGKTRQWDATTRTVIDRTPDPVEPSIEDRIAALEAALAERP